MLGVMMLAAVILVPAISAGVAAFLPTRARNRAAGLGGLTALMALLAVAVRFPEVRDGGFLVERIAWVPSLGLDLVLRLDGLSWTFGVLVLGIGALVILYARYYLSPSDPVPRFYAFLLAFIAAMLGIGPLRQPAAARLLLGADVAVLVPAHRLLARSAATPSAGRAWRSRSPAWAVCACSPV